MYVVENRRAAVREFQGDARFEEPLLRVDDVRFGDQDAEALLGRDPLACRLRVGPVAGLARPEKVVQVLAVEAVSFRLQIVADLAFDRFTENRDREFPLCVDVGANVIVVDVGSAASVLASARGSVSSISSSRDRLRRMLCGCAPSGVISSRISA
jgi:hypothetical protein